MRSLLAVLALVLTTLAGGTVAAAGPATAAKRAPDLIARGGSASYADGQLTLKLKFRNKGGADAGKNTGAFAVSKDKTVSDDDRGLGVVKVPAIRKGKGTTVTTTVTVPATVPSGTYYVVYCADYKTRVGESDEGNNCGSTKNSVKITPIVTPPPATTVTLSAVATTGGSVAASAAGGTCAGTSCTVTAGSSTVLFTPTAASGYTFVDWTGCSGYTGKPAITFTNASANATCIAVFTATTTPPPPVPTTVTVSYKGSGTATVTGAATSGTCTGTGSASATGTCTVPSGASTVTLTAGGTVLGVTWSGCTGAVSGNTITLVNPTAAVTCTATPKLL